MCMHDPAGSISRALGRVELSLCGTYALFDLAHRDAIDLRMGVARLSAAAPTRDTP